MRFSLVSQLVPQSHRLVRPHFYQEGNVENDAVATSEVPKPYIKRIWRKWSRPPANEMRWSSTYFRPMTSTLVVTPGMEFTVATVPISYTAVPG